MLPGGWTPAVRLVGGWAPAVRLVGGWCPAVLLPGGGRLAPAVAGRVGPGHRGLVGVLILSGHGSEGASGEQGDDELHVAVWFVFLARERVTGTEVE